MVREKIDHVVHVVLVQPTEDDQMQKIEIQESRVLNIAKLVDAELGQDTNNNVKTVRDLLTRLEGPMERLAQQTNASFAALRQDQRLEILRWLSPIPFSRHHEAYAGNRVPSTGNWLLNHPRYREWDIASSSSIVLLHGVPGSGKTAVVSAVVDRFLSQSPGQASLTGLAYFYCSKNPSEPERSDPDEIMRSLVRQLAFTRNHQHTVHEALVTDYERRKAEAKLDGFDMPRLRFAQCV
ncbi:MAG: hypothetical protein L6R38_002762 [Xanthoria sp. 2 TBL-2021]|nr:MAG: hypothetical protein L6R38_002762 [Xanthoria sp. 2 TBL-2021]